MVSPLGSIEFYSEERPIAGGRSVLSHANLKSRMGTHLSELEDTSTFFLLYHEQTYLKGSGFGLKRAQRPPFYERVTKRDINGIGRQKNDWGFFNTGLGGNGVGKRLRRFLWDLS